MSLKPSSDVRFAIDRVGREATPVIVIDGFWQQPDAIRNIAARMDWTPEKTYYPGIRTPAPGDCIEAVTSVIGGMVTKIFGAARLGQITGSFSLVTARPETLQRPQRLPHCDNTDPAALAILCYLSGPEHGGTGFFRHKSTGYETITGQRQSGYAAALEADIQRTGEPPAKYIGGSNPLYDRLAAYDGIYNRIMIYPSNLLHSGIIPPGFEFSDDPREGRLTLNIFAHLEGRRP